MLIIPTTIIIISTDFQWRPPKLFLLGHCAIMVLKQQLIQANVDPSDWIMRESCFVGYTQKLQKAE